MKKASVGGFCSRRRSETPTTDEEPWVLIPMTDDLFEDDEETLHQLPSFDDSTSEPSEDGDAAAGTTPIVARVVPNLRRGRLVMAGFRTIGALNERSMSAFRRNMHYWQHARMHVARILTLRKIWSNIGRILSSTPNALRDQPNRPNLLNRKLRRIWSALGRRLQGMSSKALTNHLVRKRRKLQYRHPTAGTQ